LRFFRVFYNVGTRIELLDEQLLGAETTTKGSSARCQQRAQQQLQSPENAKTNELLKISDYCK